MKYSAEHTERELAKLSLAAAILHLTDLDGLQLLMAVRLSPEYVIETGELEIGSLDAWALAVEAGQQVVAHMPVTPLMAEQMRIQLAKLFPDIFRPSTTDGTTA